jgi:hypothetical protein
MNMRKIADKFNTMILSRKNPTKSELYRKATLLSQENPNARRSSVSSQLAEFKNICELPDDVLNIIVENYLDLRSIFNLRSTCHRFYFLCSDPHLFRRVDLQPYWNLVNDGFVEVLGCVSDEMEMLNLSWTKLTDSEIISK